MSHGIDWAERSDRSLIRSQRDAIALEPALARSREQDNQLCRGTKHDAASRTRCKFPHGSRTIFSPWMFVTGRDAGTPPGMDGRPCPSAELQRTARSSWRRCGVNERDGLCRRSLASDGGLVRTAKVSDHRRRARRHGQGGSRSGGDGRSRWKGTRRMPSR